MADDPLLPRPEPRALRPAVLAIDGGNSKTDVALVAGDGTLLASARGPGINAHEVGVDQTVLILDSVVKQAADRLDRRYRPGQIRRLGRAAHGGLPGQRRPAGRGG